MMLSPQRESGGQKERFRRRSTWAESVSHRREDSAPTRGEDKSYAGGQVCRSQEGAAEIRSIPGCCSRDQVLGVKPGT